MSMKTIRVYADTSVYGGVFDDEFADASRTFFDQVKAGRFRLVLSPLVHDELVNAPEQVRRFFVGMRPISEAMNVTAEAIHLRQAYLTAAIVSPKWTADALHVALATVAECRLIVSWNFKHIVHFQKIPLYNAINATNGYGPVGIHTPQEVIAHEEENV